MNGLRGAPRKSPSGVMHPFHVLRGPPPLSSGRDPKDSKSGLRGECHPPPTPAGVVAPAHPRLLGAPAPAWAGPPASEPALPCGIKGPSGRVGINTPNPAFRASQAGQGVKSESGGRGGMEQALTPARERSEKGPRCVCASQLVHRTPRVPAACAGVTHAGGGRASRTTVSHPPGPLRPPEHLRGHECVARSHSRGRRRGSAQTPRPGAVLARAVSSLPVPLPAAGASVGAPSRPYPQPTPTAAACTALGSGHPAPPGGWDSCPPGSTLPAAVWVAPAQPRARRLPRGRDLPRGGFGSGR